MCQNDRHERLVKLSRDVTIGSKRLIFLLQRNDERSALLQQADADLAAILATFEKIVTELQGTHAPFCELHAMPRRNSS
jgi:predicted translin family RNA/ssDNA-binding protein